jgi:hypothetical protein
MKTRDKVMIALICFLLGVLWGVKAQADIPANKEVSALTLYCMTEADAVHTAKAIVSDDEVKFAEKQVNGVCHFHPSRFTAKKVLHTVTQGDKTLYVMEVESGGDTFYLVTPHKLVQAGMSV